MHVFHKTLSVLTLALLPLGALTAATPPQAAKPVATAAATVAAPKATAKPAISHDIYATWRSIQGTQLSRDGLWGAYALVAQESDGELVVRRFADGQEWRAPRGTAPAFSADGRYLAFAVQPTRADLDKAKKDKKRGDDAPKAGAAVMDLATGKVETVERVKRFAWAKDGGNTLALLLDNPLPAKPAAKPAEAPKADETDVADQEAPPAGGEGGPGGAARKAPGTELVLLDAATLKRHGIKDVADFAWARQGQALAYIVSVKDPTPARPAAAGAAGASAAGSAASAPAKPEAKADAKPDDNAREGVYLLNPAEPAKVQTLLAGAGHYKQLRFDDEGRQLAFVTNRDHLAQQAAARKGKPPEAPKPAEAGKAPDPTPFKLFLWQSGDATASVLVSDATPGIPKGWTPSEHAPLSFSKDGQRLFLGTWELPKPEAKDAPEPLKVDLWHWKDPELQSAQKSKAEREKLRNYRAVVQLGASAQSARFVQLGSPELPNVVVNDNGRYALGLNEMPYRQLMSWEGQYMDAYAVDLQTGQAKALGKKLRHLPRLSPTGRYVLGFDARARQWMAWQSETGTAINLTGKIKTRFDDIERDVPDLPNPYGFAGWTDNDDAVVLYDQFDLWSVQPASGKAANLTQGWGRKQQVQLRNVVLDTEDADQKPLPADRLVLAGTHETSRASGYYQLDLNGGAGSAPRTLIQADKMVTGLIKAKDADRIVFTQQTFSEFPDLWTSRLDLQSPQKISAANPQQAGLNWGTQELIEYKTADGKKLRALLAKPENFDPAKKYPMMVYIYEKMTDNRYRFVPPAPSQNINVSRYVSNGYIVLRPDITYTTGHPGKSAMNTVLPAVQQVIAKGYVDPKRVGIQGHSWGAYQINYLITRTNAFRAAEAGASMANMVSGYGGIRWGAGISRAFQYEHGQSRIGATPWDRPDLYVENSPIFQIHKVQTPYLTIHNDDDDAVPWYQGIEMFTALRRLGKEAYWFNYNGEKHGLRDRDNTKHYTVHMAEFFDHFLLNQPRPEWMDKPVPYLERGKRDVMGQFKPAPASASPGKEGG